jgi:hypothetical protein
MIGEGAGTAWPAEDEAGALTWTAFDAYSTTVFTEDFSADGESDAGTAGAF